MLKKGFGLIVLFFIMTSFAFASGNNSAYKNVLSKIIPPQIHYTLKQSKEHKIKGFDTLIISIKQESLGTTIHRYIWISKDKKTVIPTLLDVSKIRPERIMPKNSFDRLPVDISWFTTYLSKLPKDFKKSYGKGKTDVYLFSDPYCPYCKKQLKALESLAENNKIKLRILPFNVHGAKAQDASILFWDIEKHQGLKNAISKIEGAGYADIDKMVKDNQKKIDKLRKGYMPKMKELSSLLMEHRFNGTPVIFIMKKNNKALIFLGLSDISKYIK